MAEGNRVSLCARLGCLLPLETATLWRFAHWLDCYRDNDCGDNQAPAPIAPVAVRGLVKHFGVGIAVHYLFLGKDKRDGTA